MSLYEGTVTDEDAEACPDCDTSDRREGVRLVILCERHSIEQERRYQANLCRHVREDHGVAECICDGTCAELETA